MPVFADNDVNLGTLAYTRWVSGGTQHMVGIFVGTGVGGGLIINGQLHRGSVLLRRRDRPHCHRAQRPDLRLQQAGGCLEAVASRTAIERKVQRRPGSRPSVGPGPSYWDRRARTA